eukprot:646531-Rhodomonas_salina.1
MSSGAVMDGDADELCDTGSTSSSSRTPSFSPYPRVSYVAALTVARQVSTKQGRLGRCFLLELTLMMLSSPSGASDGSGCGGA